MFCYGAITLFGVPFQETVHPHAQVLMMVLQHHMPYAFLHKIRFAQCCVQSPLLTASRLISFPAGTKTFPFPAFPLLSEFVRSLIRGSPVQRLRAPRRSLSQLVTPFFGSESRVIHLIGSRFSLPFAVHEQKGAIRTTLAVRSSVSPRFETQCLEPASYK